MEAARFNEVPWPTFEGLDPQTQARLIAYWECRMQLDAVIDHERAKELKKQQM